MGKPATRILGATVAAVGALAVFTACGPSDTADAGESPVKTYPVPNGTVVCIWETQMWRGEGAVAGGLSCDWDHVIPNPKPSNPFRAQDGHE